MRSNYYKNYKLYSRIKTTIIKNNITDYDDIQELCNIIHPNPGIIFPVAKQHWIDRNYTEDIAEKFSRIAVEKRLYTAKDISYFKEHFGVGSVKNPSTLEFWEIRGYSDKTSPTSQDMVDDYVYKIEVNNPTRKLYWTERGYSEEYANNKVREYSIKASKIGRKKIKENPEKYNKTINTKIEYWLNKGYSEEEAKEKLKERQSTFSLKSCIEKYGEEEGRRVHEDRQRRWQETLQSKSEEEKKRINASKDGRSVKWAKRKFGKDWKEKRLEVIKKSLVRSGKASNESLKVCKPLIDYCEDNNIELLYGIDGNKEYYIRYDNNIFFYDFTLLNEKIIIEYHGYAFHPREGDYQWTNPFKTTYEEVYNKDLLKKKVAKEFGFDYYVLWSDEDNSEKIQHIIDRLIKEKNNEKN